MRQSRISSLPPGFPNLNPVPRARVVSLPNNADLQKTSLSRMIESYLNSLVNEKDLLSEKGPEISPLVKSMQTGINIPEDYEYKKDYRDHVEKRHL